MKRGARQTIAWIAVAALLAVYLLMSDPAVAKALSWKPIAVVFALLIAGWIRGVVVKRKKGQGWTEVFSEGQKMMTGNVWRDAAVMLAVGLIAFAAIGLCLILE